MKKLLKNAGVVIVYIVLTPIFLLVGILLLLYLPVDFVRYHCSDFYKETRHKYEPFTGNCQWFRLYNTMRKEKLPLDFHLHSTKDIHYGHFRYQNILLVQDFSVEYEPKKGEWFAYHEDEDEQASTSLAEVLEMSLENFHEIVGEKRCDRAVLLIDRTHIPEEDLPHLEHCPLLLGYDGNKGMADAIRQWIENNRG